MKIKADNAAQCVAWVEGLNKWREWALTTGHGNEEPYSVTGRNPFSGYNTEESNSQVGGAARTRTAPFYLVPQRIWCNLGGWETSTIFSSSSRTPNY